MDLDTARWPIRLQNFTEVWSKSEYVWSIYDAYSSVFPYGQLYNGNQAAIASYHTFFPSLNSNFIMTLASACLHFTPICICYITGTSAVLDLYDSALSHINPIQCKCAWYNEFMFQWSHTFSIAAHAQYMPHEHAEEVAGVCAAEQICYADMEAKY